MELNAEYKQGYDEGYEQGVKDVAEKIKNYYSNLKGRTPAPLVSFHIDEIVKEMTEDI